MGHPLYLDYHLNICKNIHSTLTKVLKYSYDKESVKLILAQDGYTYHLSNLCYVI